MYNLINFSPLKTYLNKKSQIDFCDFLFAEGTGFEPVIPFRRNLLSKQAH